MSVCEDEPGQDLRPSCEPCSNDRRIYNTTAFIVADALHLKKNLDIILFSFCFAALQGNGELIFSEGSNATNKGDYDAIVNDNSSLMETIIVQPGSRRLFLAEIRLGNSASRQSIDCETDRQLSDLAGFCDPR